MKITPSHLIDTAIQKPIPGGASMKTRRFLVIHFTAGASAQSSIDYWNTPDARGANAHIVIDRDGTVYQCRPFDRTAGHAGTSTWTHQGKRYDGLNACSIGIELANGGDSFPTRFTRLPPLHARHKNGGTTTFWESYTPEQLAACQALSQLLVQRYHLDDIVGHDDIAPDRKNDPGPAFPMQHLREACGFTGLPRPT